MKKLVVLTHPNIDESRINKTWIAQLEERSDEFDIHSIYAEYPSLEFDVEKEHELLEKYDEIIFQFPIHWFSTPFALKKYFDDVFTYGWAFGEGAETLKNKKFGIATSTGGVKEVYTAPAGLPVQELINDVITIFTFCGGKFTDLHVLHGIHTASEDQIVESGKEYIAKFSK